MKERKDKFVKPMELNVEKIEAQIKVWAARIQGLAAEADKADREKLDFRFYIDDLKLKLHITQTKIEEFRAAGSGNGNGEALKAGIESARNELEAAIKKADTLIGKRRSPK